MLSLLAQLNRSHRRLLLLALVLWLGVYVHQGSWEKCGEAHTAPGQGGMQELYPAGALKLDSNSELDNCHGSSPNRGVLISTGSCSIHAQIGGSISCCSFSERAADSRRRAPERPISPNVVARTREPCRMSAAPPALYVNHAKPGEMYLRSCVFLI